MSKTRKILSLVLALAMIVSTFAISANAAAAYEAEEDATKYNQTWALSEPVDNGDGTYTVNVNLTTDYETGAIQFVLTNTDATAVEYALDDEEAILLGDAIPAAYNADISASEIVDEKTNTSYVKVMIIPTTADGGIIKPVAINGVIAKVKYTLVSGSADITLKNDAASSTNPAGSLIAARVTDGNIVTGTMIVGQTAAITEGQGTVTIGASALPSDLAKKAGAEAGIIIDTAHTFGGAYDGVVFGFTQTANNTFKNTTYLTNAFEATNEGTLSIVASDGKTTAVGNYGTGTVITVTGKVGEPKKYVVVIFGDVDGNGLINTNDVKAIQKGVSVATTYANNSVQRMAANCQLVVAAAIMHTLNTNDVKQVQKQIGAGVTIDQGALATKMASLTGYYK